MLQRRWRAKGVADTDVNVVKPLLQQFRHARPFRERIGKLHAPRPRIAGRSLLRFDHPRGASVDLKYMPPVAAPVPIFSPGQASADDGLSGSAARDSPREPMASRLESNSNNFVFIICFAEPALTIGHAEA